MGAEVGAEVGADDPGTDDGGGAADPSPMAVVIGPDSI